MKGHRTTYESGTYTQGSFIPLKDKIQFEEKRTHSCLALFFFACPAIAIVLFILSHL